MATATAVSEPKKIKVVWTDDEMNHFNRQVGDFFTKKDNTNAMRYRPVSTFLQSMKEDGTPCPGNDPTGVPRYNVEMFIWKNGKNPGGDNDKVIRSNMETKGSFFIDCELFLKQYELEK